MATRRLTRTAWAAWERKAQTSEAVAEAVTRLRERTDRLYAGTMTHDEHRQANREHWDALQANGISGHVAWMLSR